MTAELNVIVRELSELTIVETKLLLLGRYTQAEARDEVHEEEDETRHEEGIREARNAVSNLVSELDVVAVEPATGDHAEAVEVRDVVTEYVCQYCGEGTRFADEYSRCKQASQQVTDDATHGMLGEDVQAIVNANPELDLCCQIADNGPNNTKYHCSPCGDKSRSRRDSNKSLCSRLAAVLFKLQHCRVVSQFID